MELKQLWWNNCWLMSHVKCSKKSINVINNFVWHLNIFLTKLPHSSHNNPSLKNNLTKFDFIDFETKVFKWHKMSYLCFIKGLFLYQYIKLQPFILSLVIHTAWALTQYRYSTPSFFSLFLLVCFSCFSFIGKFFVVLCFLGIKSINNCFPSVLSIL